MLQNRPPLITIGLTCFNAADMIQTAMNSAQKQDWDNLEILVVDDGSTDNSVDIVNKLAKEDNRIRLVCHEKNKGTAITRTSILHHAKGEFIVFFDDDDVSTPDRVRKQWERLTIYEKEHEGALVLCYTNRDVVQTGRPKPTHIYYAIGRHPPEPRGHAVADYLLWHYEDQACLWGHMGSCTLMFRKDLAMQKIGDFDESFRRCAEWDWAIRAAFQGAHFIAVDEPLIIQHITQTDDKAGKKPLLYALMLRNKHRKYLKKRHVYLASVAMAYSRFYYARRNKWLSRFYYILACLSAPHLVIPNERAKRRQRRISEITGS